jgi:glycosyltransferase involved in cell wall biosynthesis
MKKIILSAFACDPTMGSEPGYGWNWGVGLAKMGFEVHCITHNRGKANILSFDKPDNLHFYFVELPLGLEKLYRSSTAGLYIYYILWQWYAYKAARHIHRVNNIDLAHHVTWGSLQMGSFLYKLPIPFVFGPAGGGQSAPSAFRNYFHGHWKTELNRMKVSELLFKTNPAFKNMVKKARVVLVSNPDTYDMAVKGGGGNVVQCLDTALPEDFFPQIPTPKVVNGTLKLLWIGRLLPRKGILLLLEVMKELVLYKDITLTVVGDGEMRELFLQNIEDFSLQETVIWKGKVPYEEVKNYYHTHDCFIFTSLRDSGGLQLVEAMAFGLPVITINLHGQALIVDDSRGIVCDCLTPEIAIKALKAAILKLHSTPSLLTEKSGEALKFAHTQKWQSKIDDIVTKYYKNI